MVKLPKISGVSFTTRNTYKEKYRVGYLFNGKQKWRYFNSVAKADNFMRSLKVLNYY